MTSPFEFSIFFGNLNHILSRESLIKNALQTEDIAGSVLRIHLSCEQILTAWIYAACGREDFLQGTQLTFGVKLTIAENLDLPEYASKIFRNINKIRNRLAHLSGQYDIDADLLQSTKDIFHNHIGKYYDEANGKMGIAFYDEVAIAEVRAIWGEPEQPPHITLALIVSLLLQKLIADIAPPELRA